MNAPRKGSHPVRLLGANEFARRFRGDAEPAEELASDGSVPQEQIVTSEPDLQIAVEAAPAVSLFRRACDQVAETAELVRQSAQLVSRSRPRRWRRAA